MHGLVEACRDLPLVVKLMVPSCVPALPFEDEGAFIDAGQTQHGPLGKEIQLEYQLISSDPKLRKISEKTGLSTTSILKIIAIADVRKSYIFDAHQLAECLGITVRSARRIMNKIMEAGYGKVYAKKTAAAGGRPKALVEILFKI